MQNDDQVVSVEIDFLLERMRSCGWQFHYFEGTNAELALTRQCGDQVTDVAVIRADRSAIAYRMITGSGDDPLSPNVVVMIYRETPRRVLRAALTFDPPTMVLPATMNAPTDCGVLQRRQRERQPHEQRSRDDFDAGEDRVVA